MKVVSLTDIFALSSNVSRLLGATTYIHTYIYTQRNISHMYCMHTYIICWVLANSTTIWNEKKDL